jgi:hypothetical protein
MRGKGEDNVLTLHHIILAKKQLKGRIIAPIDKNANANAVICPKWFSIKMKETFLQDEHYEKIEEGTQNIFERWKTWYTNRGFDKRLKWAQKMDLPFAYFLVKNKDIQKKIRPIISYARHPMRRLLHAAASALNFMLKKIKVDNFVLWRCQDFLPTLQDRINNIIRTLGRKANFIIIPADIKNMFTELPQEAVRRAMSWFLDIVKKNNRKTSVRVHKNDLEKPSFGRSVNLADYINLTFEELKQIIFFDLENCIFNVGNCTMRQKDGIPMGSQTSPPVAVISCVFYEFMFVNTLPMADRRLFNNMRYIDDAETIIGYVDGDDSSKTHALALYEKYRNTCYHKNMELIPEHTKDGTHDFLYCEVEKLEGPQIICSMRSKNADSLVHCGMQSFPRFHHFTSFAPRRQKKGVVTSVLLNIQRCSSSHLSLIGAVLQLIAELLVLDYPWRMITDCIIGMASRDGTVVTWSIVSCLLNNIRRIDSIR